MFGESGRAKGGRSVSSWIVELRLIAASAFLLIANLMSREKSNHPPLANPLSDGSGVKMTDGLNF